MNRLSLLILLLCTQAIASAATEGDSVLTDHHSLWRTIDTEALQNPALHGAGYATSLSELALNVEARHQTEAFVVEKGRGYVFPRVTADTYLRLSERAAVWGSASYKWGKNHDVKWNSTSDYDLLQPYVLADTLGGDTNAEQYRFSGGYATRLDRWLLGAEMQVRAEQEYRRRDPRMRGIVTELLLRFGAGREMGAYQLGAALEANIYKQTNSVDFYREEGVIPEYQMTGLGTEYSRFSGDKRSLYFDGGGIGLLLSAHPTDGGGLYADIALGEHRYHRKLAEYNSMPLTDLYQEQAAATIGWRHASQSRTALYVRAEYTKRTGDEHVGGTSNARYFPVIARLTMYKNTLFNAALGALYGRKAWNVAAQAGYRNNKESYAYPQREMDYSQLYGQLGAQWMAPLSKALLLTLDADATYTANVGDKVVMPYANMDAKTILLMNHKSSYNKASYSGLLVSARGDYALPRRQYGLFARIAAGVTYCSVREWQTDLIASIGITF